MRTRILVSAACILISAEFARPQGIDSKDVVRQVVGPAFSPRCGEDWREASRVSRGACGAMRPSSAESGEFLLDTTVIYGLAPGSHGEVATASGATCYLVVWTYRHTGALHTDLHGTRVTFDGLILDPFGFPISSSPEDQGAPAVAFDGTNFLVVWEDWRGSSGRGIYGARVSQDGTVLDPEGIAISVPPQPFRDKGSPSVASNGEDFFVAWHDEDGYDIYGARVTPEGVVRDPQGIAISRAVERQVYPAIACCKETLLVTWLDRRNASTMGHDIYGARVTRAGVVLDTQGIAICSRANDQFSPTVTEDGSQFLVAWSDRRNSPYHIYGSRVALLGAVLDTQGIQISTAERWQDYPSACFDGENFVVAWEDGRTGYSDIYACRLTSSGILLDTSGIAVSTCTGTQSTPTVALGGTALLTVWTDGRSGLYQDAYGARLTQQGAVLDSQGIPISTAAHYQCSPAATFDGENFLAVWEDWRDGYDVYGARVTSQGRVIDDSGIAISVAPESQRRPAVASDGENSLVVWEDDRVLPGSADIYGARVTSQGAVLDTSGFVITAATYGQGVPSVAYDGANYLVAWTNSRFGVRGARVTPSAVVLEPSGIAIGAAGDGATATAIAFDGSNFLVAWTWSRFSGRYTDYYVSCCRITPQGNVLDPQGITVSTGVDEDRCLPAVAFDGANYLLVWQDSRNGTCDIYAARVSVEGTVLDPQGIMIAGESWDQKCPDVAFDGTNSLVVWESHLYVDYYPDIRGAHVARSGEILDSAAIVMQAYEQLSPALARGVGSQMFLAYQGWVANENGTTYNTHRIWGKMDPSPGVEDAMNDERGTMNVRASIVRGVLLLPKAVGGERLAAGAHLLDISGRKVLDLKPGANDVRALAPGIYFVTVSGVRNTVRACKVVIAR